MKNDLIIVMRANVIRFFPPLQKSKHMRQIWDSECIQTECKYFTTLLFKVRNFLDPFGFRISGGRWPLGWTCEEHLRLMLEYAWVKIPAESSRGTQRTSLQTSKWLPAESDRCRPATSRQGAPSHFTSTVFSRREKEEVEIGRSKHRNGI